MKKTVYPVDSLKHVECSVTAFNGYCPIKHFDNDDAFLSAWKARQMQMKKPSTVKTFELEFAKNPDTFYRITKKLRINMENNKPGEMKAYGYFMRNYGLTREQVDEKLGIAPKIL